MGSRTGCSCSRMLAIGAVVAFAIAVLQTSTANAQGATQAPAGFVDTGTISFAVTSDPAGLDPGVNVGQGPAMRIIASVYDGLLRYEGRGTKLGPSLAESWKVASDGSYVELRLRPGVKFHDGSRLDADVVKASLERTKALNRAGAFFLQTLKEVQIVDPMTVRLLATRPSVSLLYGLPNVYIIGRAHLADPDHGTAFLQGAENGTGPYRLVRWDRGQQLVLEKFDDYWEGWAGSHVSKVIERIIPDSGTQQLLLERGDVQMVVLSSIGVTQDPKQLASKPGLKLVVSPSYRMAVISLNSRKGPLKDVRVRRAMQLAFDYEGMKQIYKGYADIPSQPLPKGFSGAFDPTLPPFTQNLEAAKKLLADAGYPGGGFTLSFLYTEGEEQARLLGLLMQQTLQKLGVTLTLEGKPFATEIGVISNLDTAPNIQGTFTAVPRSADAGELLSTLYLGVNAGKPFNWGWYSNPDVDQMLAEADRTLDDSKRNGIYRAVMRKLMDDAASVWAAYPSLVELMRSDVQGYIYNPLQFTAIFSFYPIWLKR